MSQLDMGIVYNWIGKRVRKDKKPFKSGNKNQYREYSNYQSTKR